MTRYCPEYYSPDEVYPTEAQTESGVVFGPNGDDFTGTLVVGGGAAPTTPGTLIGQWVMIDERGVGEGQAVGYIQKIAGPGTPGVWHDSEVVVITADANGLCEFDGVTPGAKYRAWRGETKSDAFVFVAPMEDAEEVSNGRFDVIEVIGTDA